MASHRSDAAFRLFEQALALPPNERLAFLDRTCDDDAVKQDLLSLLEAYDNMPEDWFTPAPSVGWKPLHPGDRVGPYRIEAELGAGGMGWVFKARHVHIERTVAIKVPRLDVYQKALTAQKNSRHEAQALATLRHPHPHVVTLYDLIVENDTPFIVMEYVEGRSLQQRLEEAGRPAIAQVVTWGCQVADALDHLAGHDIIHGDIKSSNILLRAGRDDAVLTDFGLARDDTKLTLTLATFGTPRYMSPEQARGEKTDRRSDLYSLGVVLFECLAGHFPFDGPSPLAILERVKTAPPRSIRAFRPDLPAALIHAIDRCLSKNPADRFATGRALIRALQSDDDTIALPTPVAASPPALVAAAPTPAEPSRDDPTLAAPPDPAPPVDGRKRKLWIYLSLVVLATLALGSLYLLRPAAPPAPPPAIPAEVRPLVPIREGGMLQFELQRLQNEGRIQTGTQQEVADPSACYIFLLAPETNEVVGVLSPGDGQRTELRSGETVEDFYTYATGLRPIWVAFKPDR